MTWQSKYYFGVSRVFFHSLSTQQKSTDPQISNAVISHLQSNNKLLHKSLQQQMADNTLQLKKFSLELLQRPSKPASPVEVRLPLRWEDSEKCSLAKWGQRFLNTARIWNDMETFAILISVTDWISTRNLSGKIWPEAFTDSATISSYSIKQIPAQNH